MSQELSYKCNICGNLFKDTSKIIGLELKTDGKRDCLKHVPEPFHCHRHICRPCLNDLIALPTNLR